LQGSPHLFKSITVPNRAAQDGKINAPCPGFRRILNDYFGIFQTRPGFFISAGSNSPRGQLNGADDLGVACAAAVIVNKSAMDFFPAGKYLTLIIGKRWKFRGLSGF
jgi:hypothetical protein